MIISISQLNNQQGLDAELARLRDLEKVINTTERLARIGHYEWDWDRDCLASCSAEYARIFSMTSPQIMKAQKSWKETLKTVHLEDRERYMRAVEAMSEDESLDIKFRIQLDDNSIKHIREIGIVTNDSARTGKFTFGILQDISEQVEQERELRYRDELAQQAESITDIGHFIYDELNKKYAHLSEGFVKIYGTTVDAYLSRVKSPGDNLVDVHPDDLMRVENEYQQYLKAAENYAIEFRIVRRNGQIRWVRKLSKARLVEGGKVLQTMGVIQDITHQVNREQELLFNATIASEVEAIADCGYFLFDKKMDRNIFISPGCCRIFGIDTDTYFKNIVTGNDYINLVYEEDQALVRKAYEQDIFEHGKWKIEYRVLKPDGKLCWLLEIGKAFKRSATGVEQTIGLIRDITHEKMIEQELFLSKNNLERQVVERTRELSSTVKQLQEQIEERKKVESKLDFLANHDALTGLPSLRLCKDRLERSLADSRRNTRMTAVMFLDLDGFKKINDSLGHESGDQVLIAMAKRIQHELREMDTVARIGGDEFIIILSNLTEIQAVENIAGKLIKNISQPVLIDKNDVMVSASIGIALYPEHGVKSEQLMRAADKTMYEVKKSGKNNYAFANSNEPNTV